MSEELVNARRYSAGVATAYGAAVEGGYTGTYAEFCAEQARFAENAQQVAEDRETVEQLVETFETDTVPGAATAIGEEAARQINLVADKGTEEVDNVHQAGNEEVGRIETTISPYVDQAEEAKDNAVAAKEDAVAAKQSIENLTVSASTLATGAPATVEKTIDAQTGVANLAFGLPRGEKGDTGYPTDDQVSSAVNTWLGNNVDPTTGYVLDRTLTQENAAAPADLVGNLKESIIDEINITLSGIVNNKYITDTGILGNSNGWSATQDFISCEGYDQLVFDCNDYTRSSIYNAWYRTSSQDSTSYISNFTLSKGTITIDVPNGAKFFRVSTLTADLATLTVKGIRSIGTQVKQLNNKLIAPQYLKVLQWNVGLFNDGSSRISTAQANSQIAKLKKTLGIINADIFNAQEAERYFDKGLTIESNGIMTFKYPAKVGTYSLVSYLKQATNNPIFKWFDADNTHGFWYYDLNIGSFTITIINTHLSTDIDPSIHRNNEIAELIAFMNTKERVILTGDFNVYSDSEYEPFTDAGYTLCNGGSFGWFKTWPVNISGSEWGSEHLDNIICSANIIPQLVETVETPISDHAPVVATFMLT